MTAPLRIALIGYGRMGRNWARVIHASPDATLACVIDPALPVVEGVPVRTIGLNPRDADAVIVASPTNTHADVIDELSWIDIPMLVEKPLAATYADAREMPGARIAVGHIERFNPAVQAAAEVLASGIIGDPIHIVTTRIGGYPADPRGDVVLDLAVHDLDVLRLLLGPVRVEHASCHESRGRCDTAEIALVAKLGATATVHVDWIAPSKERTFRATCTRGALFVDYVARTGVVVHEDGRRELLEVGTWEPLAAELAAFVHFARTGEHGPLATAEDGLAAVELAERAGVMGRKGWV